MVRRHNRGLPGCDREAAGSEGDVTRILKEVGKGDRKAADELLTILYEVINAW